MKKIAYIALLCLWPKVATFAQVQSRVTTSEIQVRHFTKEQQGIYVKNGRGVEEEVLPLRSGLVFDVGRETEVRITVGDPNPLLYEYRWKGITAVNTPEYDALLTFAAALRDSQAGLPKIEARLARRPVASLDPIDKVLADASSVVSRLRDMAAGIEPVVVSSIESLENAKSEGLTLTSTLSADAKLALEAYRALRGLQLTLVADPQLGTAEQRANLALLLSYESELQRVVKELQVFRDAILQMGVPLLIGTVPYSGTQQQTALIEIASNPNARVKDPRVADRALGAYSFVVYPRSPLRVNLAPAAVYSWVDSEDGKPVGTKVAALLTFTPRAWEGAVLGFGWHVGVGADQKMPSFFFGMSMTASVFHFGGGFTLQDTLKDDTHFKPGGYVLVAVDLAPIKK